MSSIFPSIGCPCDGGFLEQAFVYEAAPAGETPFDLGGRAYRRRYDRCTVCDHWFGRHDLDLSRLYANDYVDATYGGSDGMAQKLRRIFALPPDQSDNVQRVKRIAARLGAGNGRRLLDVGAGLGVFPSAMKAAGWQVTALETDPRTVVHLREVVGVEALEAERLPSLACESARYDLISFNKVLEHVEDPLRMLESAVALLRDDGCCYVELPDVAAAQDGPGREEFFIDHHHVFSPSSVALLAARAGLSLAELLRLREPSGKFTLAAFLSRSSDARTTPVQRTESEA